MFQAFSSPPSKSWLLRYTLLHVVAPTANLLKNTPWTTLCPTTPLEIILPKNLVLISPRYRETPLSARDLISITCHHSIRPLEHTGIPSRLILSLIYCPQTPKQALFSGKQRAGTLAHSIGYLPNSHSIDSYLPNNHYQIITHNP